MNERHTHEEHGTLVLDGAAGPNGSVSLNGGITGDIMSQLRELCPEGDLVVNSDGSITPGNSGFCEEIGDIPHDDTCKCICRLITSGNRWTIRGVQMNQGGGQWPGTTPTNANAGQTQPDGSNGAGTGGEIVTPTSDSGMEFGAYDPRGNPVVVPYKIVLGHELCGHAAHMDAGDHDPRPQPKGNRPGHDQAIDEENKIREEQGLKSRRGKFDDPKKGESFARRRKS